MTRARLVERVLHKWDRWYSRTQGDAEVYLAELARTSARDWRDAVWFVGLTVALQMGRVERVGANLTITRHNLDRTSGVPAHEQFWTTIFRITTNISVVTTNFDVLAERGLRHVPRPRVPRPGFHYGFGPEELAGGGYPSYSHIQKIKAAGRGATPQAPRVCVLVGAERCISAVSRLPTGHPRRCSDRRTDRNEDGPKVFSTHVGGRKEAAQPSPDVARCGLQSPRVRPDGPLAPCGGLHAQHHGSCL